ncbi:MAG: hypothetical protein U1G07_13450 [Verrucomicrobiota bacterium]
MSDPYDSIYADLLRTGLEKVATLPSRDDLLSLFSALEHFRRDLHAETSVTGILRVSQSYIAGLNLFRAVGFWLVAPADYSFEPARCVPQADAPFLQRVVQAEIKGGRFAWALRQTSPVFIQATNGQTLERGVLHSLALSSQVVGMFIGILNRELAANQEIHFSVLSMLLGASSDAVATLHKTTQLTNQIKTLSGLLPVCAWCRKVRNDQGYWDQIESYVAAHSDASFTHCICPDCRKDFLKSHALVRNQPVAAMR